MLLSATVTSSADNCHTELEWLLWCRVGCCCCWYVVWCRLIRRTPTEASTLSSLTVSECKHAAAMPSVPKLPWMQRLLWACFTCCSIYVCISCLKSKLSCLLTILLNVLLLLKMRPHDCASWLRHYCWKAVLWQNGWHWNDLKMKNL